MVVIQFSISGFYETLPLLEFRKEKGKRGFFMPTFSKPCLVKAAPVVGDLA
jgi:hypothetical protein